MKNLTHKLKEKFVGADASARPFFKGIPKENEGITLIALIITIIVMMILVAVAVTFTIGENGIFNQAKQAVDKYKAAEILDQVEIAKISAYDPFIKGYFSKMYDNEEEFLAAKAEAAQEGYILDGYSNMEKVYNELETIFSTEIEEGKIKIYMFNDFLERALNEETGITLKESLEESMGVNLTYNTVYQELKALETEEQTEATIFLRGIFGAALHNYYIVLEYNGEMYIIKSNDSSITSIKKDQYMPIEMASNEFEWIFDEDGISIVKYKGSSTNIVIPEKIGEYTVVAIGGKIPDTDNYYRLLDGSGDVITSSISIMTLCGEDLTEENWEDIKTKLEDTDYLGYSFPEDVNSYETFVQHTKAYQKNGMYYITVSMDTTTEEIIFKEQPPEVTVKLPSTVTIIYEMAFAQSELKEINIPANITEIPDYTFVYCSSLEKVTFDEGRTQALDIGENAFQGCANLASVKIEEIEFIKDNAFNNSGLTSTAKVYIKTPAGWNESEKQAAITRIGLTSEQVEWN